MSLFNCSRYFRKDSTSGRWAGGPPTNPGAPFMTGRWPTSDPYSKSGAPYLDSEMWASRISATAPAHPHGNPKSGRARVHACHKKPRPSGRLHSAEGRRGAQSAQRLNCVLAGGLPIGRPTHTLGCPIHDGLSSWVGSADYSADPPPNRCVACVTAAPARNAAATIAVSAISCCVAPAASADFR